MSFTGLRLPSLGFFVVLALALVPAGGAFAHSEAGEMEILKLGQKGEDRILVEVGVVYADDGHIAEDASVSVVVRGPGGPYEAELEKVGDGSRFRGTVRVAEAGSFRVVATSVEPAATARGEITVEQSVDPDTSEEPATPEDVAAETATESELAATEANDEEEEEDGSSLVWLLILGFLVVVGAVVGFWLSQRRRNP